MKRLNKQVELNNDKVNIIYGSTNRYDPQILYVTCKWWCESKNAKKGKFFETFMMSLKKKFNNILLQTDAFENNSLFIPIDYLNGVEGGDKKYLFFELYLKQKTNNVTQVVESKNNIENLLEPLIKYLMEESDKNGLKVIKNKCE